MIQFEVGGHTYQAGKLDAFKQMHVARRIAPVLGGLVGLLDVAPVAPIAERQEAGEGETPVQATEAGKEALQALGPLMNAVAEMPDEHVDYIVKTCLGVVTRKAPEGAGWVPLTVRSTGALMDDSLDMADVLQIVFHVVKDNLSGFFRALPSGSPVVGAVKAALNS